MAQQNGTSKRTIGSAPASLQNLSTLTTRLSLAYQLGMSHQGERNVYETLGYPKEITPADMVEQWRRQDIARAIVDRPVKATWQGEVTVSESTEEEDTELEKAYQVLDRKLNLKHTFLRVDRLSQLGRFAIILLGFDDSAQDTWGQPVSEGERELLYTKVYGEHSCEVQYWETDPSNPRYGLPRMYKIKFIKRGEEDTYTELQVHYTRVIHVCVENLDDEVEGDPIMITAYNRLKDLEKLVGGSAEMFWRGARPGYFGQANPDYKIDDALKEKFQDQIKEYEHDLRRVLIAEGIDLESLAQQIADPTGHVEVQMKMISALSGIPLRILMGSERGELASSQDSATWKEYIQARRLETCEPHIVRAFVDTMIERGVLPPPQTEEEGYTVAWSDLFALSESERSEIGSKRATALTNYTNNPQTEMMVPLEAFLRNILKLEEDEVEQIMAVQMDFQERVTRIEDELEREAQSAGGSNEPSRGEEPAQS